MKRKLVLLGLCTLFLGSLLTAKLLSTTTEPALLYGHDNASHSIVKIDTSTGLATIVGPTTFNSGMSGMATSSAPVEGPGGQVFASGTHFGLLRDIDLVEDYIVAVDLTTGEAHKVVKTERLIGGRGIAFGSDGSTLYLIENSRLSIIDVATGSVTEVGIMSGYSSVSLELDPLTSSFLAISGDDLIQIDPSTAAATVVQANIGIGACTLSRSPNGTWYTINTGAKELVTIDVSTGDVTVVGNLGDDASGSICGSAFAIEKPLTLLVPIDIKPQSCPNPLNVKSKGVLPVAILGTENFEVADVDISTIKLEGVPQLRMDYEDVATPYEADGELDDSMDCTTDGPDGYLDLTLKIDRQEVIEALEASLERPLQDGEVLVLTLTANLMDETAIEGKDVVIIIKKGKK